MSYAVKFQTESKFRSISYGKGSIYSSGCGPASLCNALQQLGVADISVPTMCNLAVHCGARVDGGTLMLPLLQTASEKYGFTHETTSSNARLLEHLKAGGAAILHGGSQYKLFSDSGHFVAAVAASGQTVTVLDSYWYSGKYTRTSLRRNYVSVVQDGVIKTSITQCGKATADRAPSYYLISKLVSAADKKEEYDMTATPFVINGEKFDLDAINRYGNTFVDLKQFCAKLGLSVGYNAETKSRIIDPGMVNVAVNGKITQVSGMIVGTGHSYASVPEIAATVGMTVSWDSEKRAVVLGESNDD